MATIIPIFMKTGKAVKTTMTLAVIALISSVVFVPADVMAQGKLLLREFFDATEQQGDLTAKTYPKLDGNGNICALIKVQIDAENCTFEGGNSIETQYKGNEYWVYVVADYLYKFYISCPGYDKSLIDLEETMQREALQEGHTYVLYLNGYKTIYNLKTTINSSSGIYLDHGYVDLGLSVKWATCNVGASSPEQHGDYYAWGETSKKSSYMVDNSKTDGNSRYNYDISGSNSLDVAHANWCGSWRMPTAKECQELLDNCIWTWTTQNGVKGYKVTSTKNGNSLFLPAAGYRNGTSHNFVGELCDYWSSTPVGEYNYSYAFYIRCDRALHYIDCNHRCTGRPIRPVTE